MARFVSIPVRVGDAFYLERDGRSVLVDGGESSTAFPELFRHHINRSGADIVVCTHNDKDHANGIIGFLESGMSCHEIWLPGRWLDTLTDLLRPEPAVVGGIVESAIEYWQDEAERNRERPHSIEEIGAAVMAREEFRDRSEGSSNSAVWPDDIIDAIDDADTIYEQADWEPWWGWYVPRFGGFPITRSIFEEIVSEVIEAGLRIRRIALLASDNGIPVKWFEHYPHSPSGGIPDFLEPVSARQTVRVYPYRSIFARLALTTVNKESLVLYSPPDSRSPGVLFCADSDLRNMRLPVQARDIVTVPHHGAEANLSAYTTIESTLGSNLSSVTWVRSDRRSKRRPCSAFIRMPGRKICTVCRSGPPKQRILMIGRNGGWARYKDICLCQC